jgi:photosystem II stability/assembly factor-like uncharacterized protein
MVSLDLKVSYRPTNGLRLLPAVFCLLLFAICLRASPASSSWSRQPSGTLAWLHAVFFLDQNRGWAVGSKGTFLATVDGGRTWRQKQKPTDDNLNDIYFSDDKNGWLVCEKNIYELKTKDEPRTYLMNTNDGGATWAKININGADVDARLVRAVFTRGGRGWVFGEAGTAYATIDSGLTWKHLQLPTRHLLLGGTFIDEDRGWLVGAGATIIQTSDGGDTWHVSRLVDAQGVRFTATSFVDNRLGWAVGTDGKIFRTINGGRTWQQQSSNVDIDLSDVKFLNALEGWAVGSEGTAIHTFDGGLHWSVEPSGTTHPLERIFFTDRDHGWAVGFGGTIIAYGRAGVLTLTQ